MKCPKCKNLLGFGSIRRFNDEQLIYVCSMCGKTVVEHRLTPDMIEAVEEAIDIMDDPRHNTDSFTSQPLRVAFAPVLKGNNDEK